MIEHNILVAAKYYSEISAQRLSQLLDLSLDDVSGTSLSMTRLLSCVHKLNLTGPGTLCSPGEQRGKEGGGQHRNQRHCVALKPNGKEGGGAAQDQSSRGGKREREAKGEDEQEECSLQNMGKGKGKEGQACAHLILIAAANAMLHQMPNGSGFKPLPAACL